MNFSKLFHLIELEAIRKTSSNTTNHLTKKDEIT